MQKIIDVVRRSESRFSFKALSLLTASSLLLSIDANFVYAATQSAHADPVYTATQSTHADPVYTAPQSTHADLIYTAKQSTHADPVYTAPQSTQADLIYTAKQSTQAAPVYTAPQSTQAGPIYTAPQSAQANPVLAADQRAQANQDSDTTDGLLQNLKYKEIINGFETRALYLNDSDRVIGARFRHIKTGFSLDLLRIETAPQAFFWTNTVITDKSGAPHTQEHLLLGKGEKARRHGSQSDLMLVSESAATDQWRTYYHFNTSAKPSTFHNTVHEFLDLLLNPDYTDEEIRREVRNFQVRKEISGKFVLEEGGTVYNEMVSTSQRQMNVLWERLTEVLHGPQHPLSAISGGSPEGIRNLTVEQIRQFHKSHYVLSNMGMIEAVPSELPLMECLFELNKTLLEISSASQKAGNKEVAPDLESNNDLPKFPPSKEWKEGDIEFIKWPEKNDRQSGLIEIVWPATLNLSEKEVLTLDLFLSAFASGSGSPLYKMFVDSKTATVSSGATGCAAWTDPLQGSVIFLSLYDIDQSHMNQKDLNEYRKAIRDELTKIAEWKPGSPELAAFNERVNASLIESQRFYRKMVNNPPSFGERNISASLMNEFTDLEKRGGFKRYLTCKNEFAEIKEELKQPKNMWTEVIAKCRLLSISPYLFATVPDATAADRMSEEKEKRLTAETLRLMSLYKTDDEQTALRKYKEDYDKTSKQLDSIQNHADDIRLVEAPPLTKDEQLKFEEEKIAVSVPMVRSTFENLDSGSTVLALRLDAIAQEDLIYLAVLPALLMKTGFIENGKAYTADEAVQLRKKEIYQVSAYLDGNPYSNRYEIKFNSSGTTPEESKDAIKWISRYLFQPNWNYKNLTRIQDVLEQEISGFRGVKNSSHENNWEYEAASGYRFQHPLNLNTNCFLTCAHNIQRVKWRLKSYAPSEIKNQFKTFLVKLSESLKDMDRSEIRSLISDLSNKKFEHKIKHEEVFDTLSKEFNVLPDRTKNLLSDAGFELLVDLEEIPDASLIADTKTLCAELSADLQANPDDTLKKLNEIRESLLCRHGARVSIVGSSKTQNLIKEDLEKLLLNLKNDEFKKKSYSASSLVLERAKERNGFAGNSSLVGFVHPNLTQEMVVNWYSTSPYQDTRDQSIINGLAINALGGSGSESLFNRTWAAGLAYSNGSSWSPGRNIMYHADKIPSVPELFRFDASEVRKAKMTPMLLDTAISQNMRSRASMSFESRAEKMADDIADGLTPDVIHKFRQSLLDIRKKPGILDLMQEALPTQYAKILPGLGMKSTELKDGFYMVLGNEKDLLKYEKYMQDLEGPDSKLTRLWGRDFWINAIH